MTAAVEPGSQEHTPRDGLRLAVLVVVITAMLAAVAALGQDGARHLGLVQAPAPMVGDAARAAGETAAHP